MKTKSTNAERVLGDPSAERIVVAIETVEVQGRRVAESNGRLPAEEAPEGLPMETNLLKEGILTENFAGIGTVTRGMVRARAVELAIINGRLAQDASKTDWEQAKRELTGEPDADPKDVLLESAGESERWDPVYGSTGHQVPVVSNDDEDDEGRSDSEKLVEEGVQEAEHDQMLQAAREERREDRE